MIAFIVFGCIGLAIFAILYIWALVHYDADISGGESLPDDDEEPQ